VVDALLGTGVKGLLREPVRTAVDLAVRAREQAVPVLAVDTPTALDLTTGEPSDPVVRADATITFHRPKDGLATRSGRLLAGRVLVAPIGIPAQADRA
jgi:NAD(P)H-hydrate epimerase